MLEVNLIDDMFFSNRSYFILNNQQVSFSQVAPTHRYPNSDEGQALAKG